MNKTNSSPWLALLLGIGIGSVAGILFAPSEGAKTRKLLAKKIEEWAKNVDSGDTMRRIKEVFGSFNDSAVELYDQIQKEVIRNVEEVRITLGSIDRQTYYTAVEKTLMAFKKELAAANAHTRVLREQLKAEAEKLPEKVNATRKKAVSKKVR